MLHRTASPLSVIGSTCTVKPGVKQSRHDGQGPPTQTPPYYTSPPLPFPRVLGCHILVQANPSGRSHCRTCEHLLNYLTWRYMSNSVQWDDCIVCPVSLSSPLGLKSEWQLRVCWGRRPWHWVWHALRTQAVPFCSFATVCDVWTLMGHGCMAEVSSTLTSLIFEPKQDCIREECMIFINLISHVNLTCLSQMYVRKISGISRGREAEFYIFKEY